MDYLLKMINSPEDLRKIPIRKLPMLCHEIREKIISAVSDNGGHLASNLGVVELTVALHRVFDVPNDAIVWDVGHQSYAHKILTGRKDEISGLEPKTVFPVIQSAVKANTMHLMLVMPALLFLLL